MKTQHTPGPWTVTEEHQHYRVMGKRTKLIAEIKTRSQINAYEISSALIESEANIKLIAAAPELLEALTDLLEQLNGIGIPEWNGGLSLEQSQAAIAEATT